MPRIRAKNSTCSDVIAGRCVDRFRRNDVEEEAVVAAAPQLVGVGGIGVQCAGVEFASIDVHAMARPKQQGQQEAESEGDGRHHFEMGERFETDPADLLEIACTGDAVDDM